MQVWSFCSCHASRELLPGAEQAALSQACTAQQSQQWQLLATRHPRIHPPPPTDVEHAQPGHVLQQGRQPGRSVAPARVAQVQGREGALQAGQVRQPFVRHRLACRWAEGGASQAISSCRTPGARGKAVNCNTDGSQQRFGPWAGERTPAASGLSPLHHRFAPDSKSPRQLRRGMPSAMASRLESVSWQQAERMRERSGRRDSWRRPASLQAGGAWKRACRQHRG